MKNIDDIPGLGEERIPEGEAAAIEAVLRSTLEMLDTQARPVRRSQHTKQHGCVEAEFTVDSEVPEELRHGLFQSPGVYPALIRFSNGGKLDDRRKDAHGMAIKVMGVDALGRSEQDFLLVDSPAFFLRNAADYARFSRAVRNAKRSRMARWCAPIPRAPELVAFLILYSQFFREYRRELRLLKAFAGQKPASLLASRYFSATPYRLGPHAIRFSAQPVPGSTPPGSSSTPSRQAHDRLAMALREHLRDREACFDFLVQRQIDPVAMPVEDPSIAWDETLSPYRRVARLRIPPQSFDEDGSMDRCERASFQPWHSLPEHEPLGGINRVRRAVYTALFEKRTALNTQSLSE